MRRGDEGRGDRGVERVVGARARRSTPHLTSPLEGGRDELGEEVGVLVVVLGWRGACGERGFLPAQE